MALLAQDVHDASTADLLSQIQRLSSRVQELEQSNSSLMQDLRAVQPRTGPLSRALGTPVHPVNLQAPSPATALPPSASHLPPHIPAPPRPTMPSNSQAATPHPQAAAAAQPSGMQQQSSTPQASTPQAAAAVAAPVQSQQVATSAPAVSGAAARPAELAAGQSRVQGKEAHHHPMAANGSMQRPWLAPSSLPVPMMPAPQA